MSSMESLDKLRAELQGNVNPSVYDRLDNLTQLVNIEHAELMAQAMRYVRKEKVEPLEAENAKLRELVRNLWPFVKAGWVSACPNRECCLFEECDADSEYECLIGEHMAGRMRELGIEVDR